MSNHVTTAAETGRGGHVTAAGDAPLLDVRGLCVRAGAQMLLRDVDFCLRPGEALTLLGESGAGKSLLAQAVMGNLPAALRASGSITLAGRTTRAEDGAARRPHWGRSIGLLPQEPAQALDPLMRVLPQLVETYELVLGTGPAEARQDAARQLDASGLGHAQHLYPWQLSGGMAQRAAATIAQAGGAQVLLADEPTKGLDAQWRRHTIDLLEAVRRRGGCVVVVTHDLHVARALGGRTMVLRAGEVVEQGDTRALLAAPKHLFTRRLIDADPARWPRRAAPVPGASLLEARGLRKQLGGRTLFEGLDLTLHAGDRLVVQGPSGTGKSTLGNVLLGLMPPDGGQLVRAAGLAPTSLQKLYQDPVGAFAPMVSLEQALRDVARRHRQDWSAMLRHLERLGVAPALLARRPAAVSGGELQRIALARALAARPALLFADEPTSRLDPITQQEAIGVLLDAVDDSGAALVLVTHDGDLAKAIGARFVGLDPGGRTRATEEFGTGVACGLSMRRCA
ncbi:ABC transporter ATP-binding protein [uncultured Pseudacidovorax sp.]|uniref:ABC transporter ATP-binding protein n=1 Tax=uncultured Pseudacidovorax sp. TaxID=679313 RepID=UPI0025F7B655|nr:ATP-binding cassette domain-containing protein [uncultured Pseudacidovorax sp.]